MSGDNEHESTSKIYRITRSHKSIEKAYYGNIGVFGMKSIMKGYEYIWSYFSHMYGKY
jgi:hypothetical protein